MKKLDETKNTKLKSEKINKNDKYFIKDEIDEFIDEFINEENDYEDETESEEVFEESYKCSLNIYPTTEVLSREEVTSLFTKLKDEKTTEDEKKNIKDKIILHNTRLVVFVAKRYVTVAKSYSMEDLCQTGIIGLVKAIERYDYTLGYSFSTYAFWWIRQSIERELCSNDALIRKPVYLVNKHSQFSRMREKWLNEYNREPSKEEFLAFVRKNLSSAVRMTEIEDYYLLNPLLISLNTKYANEEGDKDCEFSNFISESLVNENISIEDEIIKNEMWDYVLNVIKNAVTEKEYSVLVRRFGLKDNRIETLSKIGYDRGCSKENIRQIESRAIRKIKIAFKKENLTNEFLRQCFK